tara:strand:+ start:419 stop:901 length:483 start_codon:yes stop_codon:yes gene_type:complete
LNEQPNAHLIVLLGCENPQLQDQRIQTVLDYIESTSNPIILYLSGGTKNGNTDTESSIMQTKIQKLHPHLKIYTDTNSKNTVENFVNFNDWIQSYNKPIQKVIITTSDFHKERAQKIFKLIINDVEPEWNVSRSNCGWCWDAEKTHMENIQRDVNKALRR